jgi:hypothetical protein
MGSAIAEVKVRDPPISFPISLHGTLLSSGDALDAASQLPEPRGSGEEFSPVDADLG